MTAVRFVIAASLTVLVAACAMPQPPSPSIPQPSSSGSSGSQGSQGSSQGSSGSSGSQGASGGQGSQGASGAAGSSGSQGSAGSSGSASSPGGAGGGITVGDQLPWPSADVGVGDAGGVDDAFEDSLGDFDEAIAGGAGAGGPEEEIDILDPMGGGSSGAPTDEPLFEEGNPGEEGDMAENQSIAQRAASGASGSSSSSGGGQEGGSASGEQSGSEQSQSQNSAASGGSGGGGAGAQQGDRAIATTSAGGAEQGGEDIIPIPEDIGDGRNDDIVLRQIREAAMNERDPVLRERLWEEYRRIRGSR